MTNKLQAKNMSCSGLLTVYLAWEIGRILEAVHNAQIIHGDVKPDNFMILHRLVKIFLRVCALCNFVIL